MLMDKGNTMYATATLERGSSSSIKDTLSDSGFTPEQALTIERAMANLQNFTPSYWLVEFQNSGFDKDQASLLVDLFTRRARGE